MNKQSKHDLSAPRPECTTDSECPDHLACIQEKCLDPCTTLACGVNAQCSVKRHRAICACRRGFIGDPNTVCKERKITLWSNFSLISNCYEISSLAGCQSDSECETTLVCYDRECQDPCNYQTCGENAVCTPRSHTAYCSCLEGFRGNPYDRCRQYECLVDSDCHDTLRCESNKCVDPCQCAEFADCTAQRHRGICQCIPDYTGNPYGIACRPSKSVSFVRSYFDYCLHSNKHIFSP